MRAITQEVGGFGDHLRVLPARVLSYDDDLCIPVLSSLCRALGRLFQSGDGRLQLQEVFLTQFSSLTQSCLTLCDPTDCSTPGFPVHHQLLELVQTHVHWVGDTIQPLILCCPLLLVPLIFSSIQVFSNDLSVHIRSPRYFD